MSIWTFPISNGKYRAGAQERVVSYLMGFGIRGYSVGGNWCWRYERGHTNSGKWPKQKEELCRQSGFGLSSHLGKKISN